MLQFYQFFIDTKMIQVKMAYDYIKLLGTESKDYNSIFFNIRNLTDKESSLVDAINNESTIINLIGSEKFDKTHVPPELLTQLSQEAEVLIPILTEIIDIEHLMIDKISMELAKYDIL